MLLVDDNQDLLHVTTMILKVGGFEVFACGDGKSCIEIAEKNKPDLILLDIDMPIMDGFATCDFIRKQPWGRPLKIIAFTGYDKEEMGSRWRGAGFDGYCPKPVDWQELQSMVRNAIATGTVVCR